MKVCATRAQRQPRTARSSGLLRLVVLVSICLFSLFASPNGTIPVVYGSELGNASHNGSGPFVSPPPPPTPTPLLSPATPIPTPSPTPAPRPTCQATPRFVITVGNVDQTDAAGQRLPKNGQPADVLLDADVRRFYTFFDIGIDTPGITFVERYLPNISMTMVASEGPDSGGDVEMPVALTAQRFEDAYRPFRGNWLAVTPRNITVAITQIPHYDSYKDERVQIDIPALVLSCDPPGGESGFMVHFTIDTSFRPALATVTRTMVFMCSVLSFAAIPALPSMTTVTDLQILHLFSRMSCVRAGSRRFGSSIWFLAPAAQSMGDLWEIVIGNCAIAGAVGVLHLLLVLVVKTIKGLKEWRSAAEVCYFPSFWLLIAGVLFQGIASGSTNLIRQKEYGIGVPMIAALAVYGAFLAVAERRHATDVKFVVTEDFSGVLALLLPSGRWEPRAEAKRWKHLFGDLRVTGWRRMLWVFFPVFIGLVQGIVGAFRSTRVTTCVVQHSIAASVYLIASLALVIMRPHSARPYSFFQALSYGSLFLLFAGQARASFDPGDSTSNLVIALAALVQCVVVILRVLYSAVLAVMRLLSSDVDRLPYQTRRDAPNTSDSPDGRAATQPDVDRWDDPGGAETRLLNGDSELVVVSRDRGQQQPVDETTTPKKNRRRTPDKTAGADEATKAAPETKKELHKARRGGGVEDGPEEPPSDERSGSEDRQVRPPPAPRRAPEAPARRSSESDHAGDDSDASTDLLRGRTVADAQSEGDTNTHTDTAEEAAPTPRKSRSKQESKPLQRDLRLNRDSEDRNPRDRRKDDRPGHRRATRSFDVRGEGDGAPEDVDALRRGRGDLSPLLTSPLTSGAHPSGGWDVSMSPFASPFTVGAAARLVAERDAALLAASQRQLALLRAQRDAALLNLAEWNAVPIDSLAAAPVAIPSAVAVGGAAPQVPAVVATNPLRATTPRPAVEQSTAVQSDVSSASQKQVTTLPIALPLEEMRGLLELPTLLQNVLSDHSSHIAQLLAQRHESTKPAEVTTSHCGNASSNAAAQQVTPPPALCTPTPTFSFVGDHRQGGWQSAAHTTTRAAATVSSVSPQHNSSSTSRMGTPPAEGGPSTQAWLWEGHNKIQAPLPIPSQTNSRPPPSSGNAVFRIDEAAVARLAVVRGLSVAVPRETKGPQTPSPEVPQKRDRGVEGSSQRVSAAFDVPSPPARSTETKPKMKTEGPWYPHHAAKSRGRSDAPSTAAAAAAMAAPLSLDDPLARFL